MSHNVMIENVKIASVEALRMAVANLKQQGVKIELNETSKTFRTYFNQPNKCDMSISLPGERYDIGLVKQPDGVYTPVYDSDLYRNQSIACEYNPRDKYDNRGGIGKLLQEYALCVTEREAALAGHCCTRQKGENGDVQVVIEMA